ncbi:MAG TPA: hypothetical protein VLT61_15980, partial [Anaeromyxobacteraceae bacterium]|nr:hypothetical protein [Anaeromyxobacteraceae bacterium]
MALPPSKSPLRPGAPARPAREEDVLARAKREKDELEGACGEAEEELEEIKVRYEKYFLGVERKPPHREREELKKKVLRLKSAFTRNAGLKFRVQSLHARFLSYERMWERSVREKEEGTYHRDVFKARIHRQAQEQRAAEKEKEEAPPPAQEQRAPPPPGPPAAAAVAGAVAQPPAKPP